MASNVSVLCPNGHRVTVKVTPTTSVLHIVEEVCGKKGFDPDAFDIKSEAGKTPIDVTLQIRYANLPNNAKLELIRAATPRGGKDAKVSISLQLPDGARLKPRDFVGTTSLLDVIEAFESQEGVSLKNGAEDGSMEPVVIFMRDQICGVAQLKRKTLKSLGLISGRGLLRLMHRAKTEEITTTTTMDTTEETSIEKNPFLAPTAPLNDPLAGMKLNEQQRKMIDSITQGYHEFQRETGQTPMAAVPESSSSSTTTIAAFPGPSRDFLPPVLETHPATTTTKKVTPPPPPVAVVRPQMEFSNFRFPDSQNGSSSTSLKGDFPSLPDASAEPCDRELKVFDLEVVKSSNDSNDSNMEVDDSFFDLTIDDLRSRMADLQRTVSDDEPLLTSAMRERRRESKFANYHRTLIRVYFPNRLVLQGMFRLKETLGALYDFVAANIESPHDSYYLYVAPPKQELKDKNETMMEAGLAPAANVYFGSKVNANNGLSKDCLKNVASASELQSSLERIGRDSKTEVDGSSSSQNSEKEETSSGPPAKRPTTDAKGKMAGGSGGKMPKWFAAGQKK